MSLLLLCFSMGNDRSHCDFKAESTLHRRVAVPSAAFSVTVTAVPIGNTKYRKA